jgi:hypothetical protein
MQTSAISEIDIKHLGDKEDEILGNESQPAAVYRSVLNVEMSERFLAQDGEIREAEHFLAIRKLLRFGKDNRYMCSPYANMGEPQLALALSP